MPRAAILAEVALRRRSTPRLEKSSQTSEDVRWQRGLRGCAVDKRGLHVHDTSVNTQGPGRLGEPGATSVRVCHLSS